MESAITADSITYAQFKSQPNTDTLALRCVHRRANEVRALVLLLAPECPTRLRVLNRNRILFD